MNITDQALWLMRDLKIIVWNTRRTPGREAQYARASRLHYRAYLRWKRRSAIVAGEITPTTQPYWGERAA